LLNLYLGVNCGGSQSLNRFNVKISSESFKKIILETVSNAEFHFIRVENPIVVMVNEIGSLHEVEQQIKSISQKPLKRSKKTYNSACLKKMRSILPKITLIIL
jgi:hypothetical protein